MTTEKFLEKAKEKYGDLYDYSKVIYVRSTDKVIIGCRKHGDFLQSPHKHMHGCGCRACAVEAAKARTLGNTAEFINKAFKVHLGKYTYLKTNYINAKTPVTITCLVHGDFSQTPDSHLRGCGCVKCSNENTSNRMKGNKQVSVENFKKRASLLHNGKYKYNDVMFKVTTDKILIECPIHGEFKLTVNKHLLGKECPKCSMHTRVQNGWSYKTWEIAGSKSSNFVGFSVYYIKCYNESETFYKVGKTFVDIKKRVQRFKEVGYNVEILQVWTGTALEMSIKEKEIHMINIKNKYIPTTTFCGSNECYTEVVL